MLDFFFLMWILGLNSGPHASSARTLFTELSLQPDPKKPKFLVKNLTAHRISSVLNPLQVEENSPRVFCGETIQKNECRLICVGV